MKKLFFLFIPLAFLFACNNAETKKCDDKCCDKEKTEKNDLMCKENIMTVDTLLTNIESFIDKEVTVCGLCSHICDHSGKNLFLLSFEDSETLIIGKAGDDIEKFDKCYENKDIVVNGILRAVEVESEEEIEVHHDVKLEYYIEISKIQDCSCKTKCTGDAKISGCCSGKTESKCCGGHKDGHKSGGCKDK